MASVMLSWASDDIVRSRVLNGPIDANAEVKAF